MDIIKDIPQQPQVQYDLNQQLSELKVVANRLGLYDAADYIDRVGKNKSVNCNCGPTYLSFVGICSICSKPKWA